MKKILIVLGLMFITLTTFGQKEFTKYYNLSVYSQTKDFNNGHTQKEMLWVTYNYKDNPYIIRLKFDERSYFIKLYDLWKDDKQDKVSTTSGYDTVSGDDYIIVVDYDYKFMMLLSSDYNVIYLNNNKMNKEHIKNMY